MLLALDTAEQSRLGARVRNDAERDFAERLAAAASVSVAKAMLRAQRLGVPKDVLTGLLRDRSIMNVLVFPDDTMEPGTLEMNLL
ncbi:hypothetical protein [Mycobacterium sp. URHB0021]